MPEINNEMQDTNIIPILPITFRSIAQIITQIATTVKIEYRKILSLLVIRNFHYSLLIIYFLGFT